MLNRKDNQKDKQKGEQILAAKNATKDFQFHSYKHGQGLFSLYIFTYLEMFLYNIHLVRNKQS